MKDWHSEDEIKAQLRELTRETRKLRNGLDALLRPSKTFMPRAVVHDRAAPDREPRPPRTARPRPDREK